MSTWLYVLIGVGVLVGYIVIGRFFSTAWHAWMTDKSSGTFAGIFWPVILVILVVMVAYVICYQICRFVISVVVYLFGRILFPAADLLGKKFAELLDKLP